MSEVDDENDIWEYKPLQKTKRPETSGPSDGTVPKRRLVSKRAKKGEIMVKKTGNNAISKSRGPNATETECISKDSTPRSTVTSTQSKQIDGTQQIDKGDEEALTPGDFCPVCQMPFSVLVVQSQRWHVAECLETPVDESKECPDGTQCSSTIPSHYKRYNHTLLAHFRATNDPAFISPSQERTSSEVPSGNSLDKENQGSTSLVLECSQNSATGLPTQGSPSSTGCGTSTPSKLTNALLLLRSPAPEDIRKKKGWSPSVRGVKSATSQDSKMEELTPIVTDRESPAIEGGFVKAKPSPSSDDGISYSPLSEFPTDHEISGGQPRKHLFPNSSYENENNESIILFSDDPSLDDEALSIDDELFSDISQFESNGDTQVMSISSLADSNHSTFTAAKNGLASPLRASVENTSVPRTSHRLQSPQSIVLEQLREHISSTNSSNALHAKSLNASPIKTEQTSAVPKKGPSSPKISLTQLSQASMAPTKGPAKAGPSSGLKQTDIGVFFGLKPLKEQAADTVLPEQSSGPGCAEASRGRRERGGRQRRNRGASADVVLNVEETPNNEGTQKTQEGGGRRGWGGGRRWRNRGKTDGEPEEPRRCPFYKKIPGTKFVVDAFLYGVIDGITAYFLTHFHSDHYGGLRKNSTLPIYCNKITGNLVKSKLKVEERYVHILPMNTEVTVDGVKVILLEANHCPGAAMLLLLLPDGQTVLHVGDFRADPSMERYPPLLSCRVQTLYLDTTYCSPEYTFPSQQEAISFAASTAFEHVTLNPRTLIVCGSYSVGKEKVFLALAEVLGSKVSMSRDKFNTMCCLESKHIKQLITTDWRAAQVHVLPMMQLKFKNLQAHLGRFAGQYDQLVAFKPTGWTFSQKVEVVQDIQPYTSGNISIYGIPYSEHSSFLEMKRFVQWLRPLKIIPTVNVGSRESRKAMDTFFSEWLAEAKAKAI
ncbi:DNA cross-link repair 1A protein isoform X1 [Osmerus eperlanus]|uniref:DNA cross-link repair 1A protein isoform X1 n=1 Tax=Osmerus eperlanus TaxID=29151 RepID=UPI002E1615F7